MECKVRLPDIPDGAPVTYAERITCTADGVASEYLVAVWCDGRYEFQVSLTRSQRAKECAHGLDCGFCQLPARE